MIFWGSGGVATLSSDRKFGHGVKKVENHCSRRYRSRPKGQEASDHNLSQNSILYNAVIKIVLAG